MDMTRANMNEDSAGGLARMMNKIDHSSPAGKWGRNGDTTMAHVAPGEAIVPTDVISKETLQRLISEMAAAGMPVDQYIVGSPTQSINPETGQPEYFKKFFKKIISAVNKIPVVGEVALPIAATVLTGNPAIGAAVAGAQTKVQGGSWGQAIGNALGSYVGAQVGGPSRGYGANAAVGSALNEAGQLGLTNVLGRTLSNTAISSVTGAYLGSTFGQAIGNAVDPQKMPNYDSQSANYAQSSAPLPTGSTGGVAIPSASGAQATQNAATEATKGSGVTGIPAGINYLTNVIDRNTGQQRTINSTFSNNYDRRNSWGSGVAFA